MTKRTTKSEPVQTPEECPEKITYLLNMKNGTQQKVTIPATWKVTFGPLSPGSKDHSVNSSGATSLRFYSSNDRQRACFTGVESFRDMSIAIEEKVTKTQEETFFKDTPGGRKSVVVEGRVSQWRNPDEPQPTEDNYRNSQLLALAREEEDE